MEKAATTVRGAMRHITSLGGYPVTVRAMGAAGRPTRLMESLGAHTKISELLACSPENVVVVRPGV